MENPTIDAVVFTVNDALGTSEFWAGGVMGNMTINGAIVSNFMDVEGEFSGCCLVTVTTRFTTGTAVWPT